VNMHVDSASEDRLGKHRHIDGGHVRTLCTMHAKSVSGGP
jgi:hypothetical protein